MKNRKMFSFALLILVLAFGCEEGVTDQELQPTPEDIQEAELMAMCLSGKVTAPEDLTEQMLDDLLYIRNNWKDDFEPINSIRFWPPWVPGNVIIGFNDSTAQKIRRGEYNAWDKLNEQYQVIEIDTTSLDVISCVVLSFEDNLNSRRLAELYEGLPGVIYTEPNYYIGDRSNVYPKIVWDGISYLFRDAWGDCPAGCISNEYWYFGSKRGIPLYIGHWIPDDDSSEPYWWSEAKQNREQYGDF